MMSVVCSSTDLVMASSEMRRGNNARQPSSVLATDCGGGRHVSRPHVLDRMRSQNEYSVEDASSDRVQ